MRHKSLSNNFVGLALVLVSIMSLPSGIIGQSGHFEVLDYTEFKSEYLVPSDRVIIFNFWATWCKPCVKEMPHFIRYAEENPNVELILVSLDFPRHFESRLRPFLVEKDILNTVVVLDEANANVYIDDIDPSWQGSIPATLLWKQDKLAFAEREFHTYNELSAFIEKNINNHQ